MQDLIVSGDTSRRLQQFIKLPAQSSLVIGPKGVGKMRLAVYLAEELLKMPSGFADYPYGLTIEPAENGSIGIEAIRQLEKFLSLKVPVKSEPNRVAIIDSIDNATTEAQNALLKILEEPPVGTIIIMTAPSEHQVLPTIRSRVHVLKITRPDFSQLQVFFKSKGFDEKAINQAYVMSGGMPGLMQSILLNQNHPLKLATKWARELLSQPTYYRLIAASELAKQSTLARDVCFILQQMAEVKLKTSDRKTSAKWQKILKASYRTNENLHLRANPKLALTDMVLNLPYAKIEQ